MMNFDPFENTRELLQQLEEALNDMGVESVEEAVLKYKQMEQQLRELND